jgi:hypothetical protein
MLGFWLVPRCWDFTGTQTMLRKELGFGVAFVVITGITVWIADVFWRTVDERCVSLAKRIEKFDVCEN